MRVGQYSKSIVMILASALGIYVAAKSDGVVTPVEYVNIGIGIVTAIGVYLLPNLPSGAAKFTKAFVAFGGAALTALAVIASNAVGWSGVTPNDWLSVVLAGLAAIGLYIIPNTPAVPAVTVVGNDPTGGETDPSLGLPESVPIETIHDDVVPAVTQTKARATRKKVTDPQPAPDTVVPAPES